MRSSSRMSGRSRSPVNAKQSRLQPSSPEGTADFSNIHLRVLAGDFVVPGISLFVEQWQQRTKATVEVTSIPFSDLYEHLMAICHNRVDPTYDIVIYSSNWTTELATVGYIVDLESYMAKKDNWSGVLPQVQRLAYCDGHRFSLPLDGDVIFGYYRRDALENNDYRLRFLREFGWPLRPPRTWSEYADIAAFFTGWDWAQSGRRGYGVLEAMGPHDIGVYLFIARAAAYSAHPKYSRSLFFDPVTMKAHIASPGFVRALDEWIAVARSGPPEMTKMGGHEVRKEFVRGDYALALDWADIGIMAQHPTLSLVKGKVSCFIACGSDEVYNYRRDAWDHFERYQHAPFQAWGGWHASLTATGKHVDAAWDFIAYLDTTRNALTAVTTPDAARNPYRLDHFDPAAWIRADVHYTHAASYLRTQWSSLTHYNAQPDLRIRKAGQYMQVLDEHIQHAITGHLTSAEALRAAANAWDNLTANIGVEWQRSLYVGHT